MNARIVNRKVVFLDMNIWIDLAEERTQIARNVKEMLCRAFDAGKVFCPLSWGILDELYKQDFKSIVRVAELMEKLSMNISFARKKEIHNREIENFVIGFIRGSVVDINKSDLYVPIFGHLCSLGELSFPEGWNEQDAREVTDRMAKKLRALKLTELIDMQKNDFPDTLRDYTSIFGPTWKKRWDFSKGNKEKMRRVEAKEISNTIILPTMNRIRRLLPIDMQLRFLEYIQSLPSDRYGGRQNAILLQMPALRYEIEVLTVSGYDPNRKGTMNDFYDIEMLSLPLAYADVLVAHDKWISHLVTKEMSGKLREGFRYFYSLEHFESYLKTELPRLN